MGDFFEAIEHIGLIEYIAHTNFWYGLFTVMHYFTLFAMTGTVIAYDLHLLGLVARDQTATQFGEEIFPWIWTTMGLAIFSGFVLWLTDAGDYYRAPAMLIKIGIVVVAVLVTWFIRRSIRKWDEAPSMPIAAKVTAVISLALWLGAILWGNNIAALCGLG